MKTLEEHLTAIVDDAGPHIVDLDVLAAYIAGRIDAALRWPESPLGKLLETIDGPVLERAVIALLEDLAEHGPGRARTVFGSLRHRVQTWAAGHPARVEARRQRRRPRAKRFSRLGWLRQRAPGWGT